MARVKLLWALLWHGKWRPIEVGIAVIGIYDTLVGEFLPDWPRVGTLVPQLHWWGWVILLLIVLLIAVLEGAYRMSKNNPEQGLKPTTEPPVSENKLAIVAKAIMDTKRITSAGKDLTVYFSDSNGLKGILPNETMDILTKLQNDEKVIMLKSFPDWKLPYANFNKNIFLAKEAAILDPQKDSFVVTVLKPFDKWYKKIERRRGS